MWKKMMTAAVFAATVVVPVQPAAAFGPGGFARDLSAAATMDLTTGSVPGTSRRAPVFDCDSDLSRCRAGSTSSLVVLTSYREGQLRSVHAAVNSAVRALDDAGNVDAWKVSASADRSDELAHSKRQQLIALGWAPHALRVVALRTSEGTMKSVLMVKTSKGELSLDSQSTAIRVWKKNAVRSTNV